MQSVIFIVCSVCSNLPKCLHLDCFAVGRGNTKAVRSAKHGSEYSGARHKKERSALRGPVCFIVYLCIRTSPNACIWIVLRWDEETRKLNAPQNTVLNPLGRISDSRGRLSLRHGGSKPPPYNLDCFAVGRGNAKAERSAKHGSESSRAHFGQSRTPVPTARREQAPALQFGLFCGGTRKRES